ncbi:MAG TPA: hypothetical protein VFT69_17680 [Pseudolabrys sp.]|jgi:hypothetical protein|nr:hypothetical protein [Pseudolabrys sp.]
MTTSEQLEHRAELTRAKIVDSLSELRDRLTPGHVVDQALDYARDRRVGEFFRNAGREVVNNPMPVLLVGAGVAWLAFAANRRPNGYPRSRFTASAARTSREASRSAQDFTNSAARGTSDMADSAARTARAAADSVSSWADRAGDTASGAWQSARETGSAVAERASAAASRAGSAGSSMMRRAGAAGSSVAHGVGSAASAVAGAASSAYDSTAYGARRTASVIGRSAGAVANSAAHAGRGAADLVKEEPLVLAGIGLAVGAAIGAMLPMSETENRYMGARSDALKRDAAEKAEHTWEKTKDVAQTATEKAWGEVKNAAQEEGLMSHETGADGGAERQASIVPSTDTESPADEVSQRDVVRPGT